MPFIAHLLLQMFCQSNGHGHQNTNCLEVRQVARLIHKLTCIQVLNHHGNSATGGHYTLDVLHPDPRKTGREGWIRIDDDNVQNIFEEDLAMKDEDEDRSAYLLFYRQMPGTERS